MHVYARCFRRQTSIYVEYAPRGGGHVGQDARDPYASMLNTEAQILLPLMKKFLTLTGSNIEQFICIYAVSDDERTSKQNWPPEHVGQGSKDFFASVLNTNTDISGPLMLKFLALAGSDTDQFHVCVG